MPPDTLCPTSTAPRTSVGRDDREPTESHAGRGSETVARIVANGMGFTDDPLDSEPRRIALYPGSQAEHLYLPMATGIRARQQILLPADHPGHTQESERHYATKKDSRTQVLSLLVPAETAASLRHLSEAL